jgi:hypothetical protein
MLTMLADRMSNVRAALEKIRFSIHPVRKMFENIKSLLD